VNHYCFAGAEVGGGEHVQASPAIDLSVIHTFIDSSLFPRKAVPVPEPLVFP
jgi:hypothetical protein